MRRLPAALCALACAAFLTAALALYPQSPVPEGMNRTGLKAIHQKYGLEPPRDVQFKQWLNNLLSGDWGWSRK